jgi:benzoyl-CoA reductase/2-hydroxyglutaryl-CoA dehydratase subunit BcrC/BadD/HgdB
MAEATLDGIPDARQRPNSPFYRWLRERLDERGARGIVLYRHPWCDLWHAELARLRDWSRLPVLDLEASSDGRNDGRIDARARGRIDALIEMLR